eukprot:TRINITY_DN67944_c1_g4_i3.p1 TRINITY_DN67944_c1_g4~~TRINITY_DN67944_c1_g4_i3.p1  ORF type:complete len:333 (-),score=-5.58 TRINITY_DN67944_c1_g4_i3:441-1439(-)
MVTFISLPLEVIELIDDMIQEQTGMCLTCKMYWNILGLRFPRSNLRLTPSTFANIPSAVKEKMRLLRYQICNDADKELEPLRQCTSLGFFHLSENFAADHAGTAVAGSTLRSMSNLLSFTAFGWSRLTHMPDWLLVGLQNKPHLQELVLLLSGGNIQPTAFHTLASISFPSLRWFTLSVASCRINDEHLMKLALLSDTITNNLCTFRLRIGKNQDITPAGIQCLSNTINRMQNLCSLTLGLSNLPAVKGATLAPLCAVIVGLPQLRTLMLELDSCTTEALEVLAQGSLKTLEIKATQFEGAEAVKSTLLRTIPKVKMIRTGGLCVTTARRKC